jgi:hypothetical protein
LKKGGVMGEKRVIDIIDYAVEDEKDAEGLRAGWTEKSKERVAEEDQQKILKEKR